MIDTREARLKATVEVLDAYVPALDQRDEVLAWIFDSETAEDAEAAVGPVLGVSGTGATAIMNLRFRPATRTDRARVRAERDERRRLLAELAGD